MHSQSCSGAATKSKTSKSSWGKLTASISWLHIRKQISKTVEQNPESDIHFMVEVTLFWQMVLAMGNYMNKGNTRVGQAAGFRISFLSQVTFLLFPVGHQCHKLTFTSVCSSSSNSQKRVMAKQASCMFLLKLSTLSSQRESIWRMSSPRWQKQPKVSDPLSLSICWVWELDSYAYLAAHLSLSLPFAYLEIWNHICQPPYQCMHVICSCCVIDVYTKHLWKCDKKIYVLLFHALHPLLIIWASSWLNSSWL